MSRRRGPSGWGPRALPGIRNRLVVSLREEEERLRALAEEARRVGVPMAGALMGHVRTYEEAAESAGGSTLIWVSESMARVVIDASQDVPAIDDADCPEDRAFVVFQSPLPPIDTRGFGGLSLRDGLRTDIPYMDPVPVDAIGWSLSPGAVRVDIYCRPERLPLPVYPGQSELVSISEMMAPIPVVFAELHAVDREGSPLSNEGNRGILAFLSAMWVLMRTPTTVS